MGSLRKALSRSRAKMRRTGIKVVSRRKRFGKTVRESISLYNETG